MKTLRQMLDAANAAAPRIAAAEARRMIEGGAMLLDVRDAPELERQGRATGAVHVPRGMLEFRADPDSPHFDPRFDRGRAVLVLCASGGRSALAAQTLREMGYAAAFNAGGLKDWADGGGAVEPPTAAAA